ncbi:hypothetical protein D3C76_170630 [compost metagenome]
MQGGQGGAQVVGNIGHQLATLLILAHQRTPLFTQARLHLAEGGSEHGDFIGAGSFVNGHRWGGRDRGGVDVEVAHGFGQPVQGPGDQGKGGQAGKQAQQGDQADGPERGVQGRAGGAALGKLVVDFAEQYHIEVAHRLAIDLQGRGTEDLAPLDAARVVTENRQRLAGQQAPHGFQVDPFAAQAPGRRGIADDAPGRIEQVHLHARVDQHQLAEQLAQGVGLEALGVHQLGIAGNVRGQVAGQPLHHLQLVHAAGVHLQPRRGAAAHQQQQGEHQGQALAEGQFHGCGSLSANL